jgi:cytochrome-b5 reductase
MVRSIYLMLGARLTEAAPRKVLKPNEFQQFELKEKTILSHNTAM